MKAKYCRYNDPRPTIQQLASQGLGRNELEDFNKFIRGLKVSYMIPNQPNTRRVWKINGTRQPCKTQRLVETSIISITLGTWINITKYNLSLPVLLVLLVWRKWNGVQVATNRIRIIHIIRYMFFFFMSAQVASGVCAANLATWWQGVGW